MAGRQAWRGRLGRWAAHAGTTPHLMPSWLKKYLAFVDTWRLRAVAPLLPSAIR